MSFETYVSISTGRSGLGNSISLTDIQISFGKKKPPYEYVVIEYDIERMAIRFNEGNPNNGFMVKKSKKSNYYYVSCSNFLKKGYLEKGRYSPVNGSWTFVRDPRTALDWQDL